MRSTVTAYAGAASRTAIRNKRFLMLIDTSNLDTLRRNSYILLCVSGRTTRLLRVLVTRNASTH